MDDRERPLWSLSASELGIAYANGLSPNDVTAATLARIRDINSQLNAIVTLDEAGAVKAAQDSARRWKEGRQRNSFDGVPVTIKDNIQAAGLRATWGSRLYRDFVPDRDETPVARLREAGAVILGKTNVPELTLHGYTDNALFGVTGNPWDPRLTPGGSSGGAVAAVASGMGAVALATDGGGSIRRPAAHTGLVGFKPSRDMVPRNNGFPAILHNFEVVGPIARCVDDVIGAMAIIVGPVWPQAVGEGVSARPRIAYAPGFSGVPVDPYIREVIDRTVADGRSLGLEIERVAPFELADPLAEVWPVISQTGVAWLMAGQVNRIDEVSPVIADMAAAGDRYAAKDYLNALDIIAAMQRTFDRFFERYDFLITPATAAMPWPAKESHPPVIDGQPVGPRGHAVFTPFANALGLPAISLPCRIDDGALPVGVQIVTAANRDRSLLSFAREFESRLFVHRWPPRFGPEG
ncbi:amidase [Bradyrhizobium sp. dw_78]|uniref:amidase n=1 Tax=Bradyrhizobium sp. dw_78 TaxID=2719793 RepID=UPI001BD63104|nr:amidase [Bradyrhizobium sp. dw_78]